MFLSCVIFDLKSAFANRAMDTDGTDDATEVNDLSPSCLVAVFGILGAADTARAMCVHPLWAEYLGDDILWKPHLYDVFAQSEACMSDGTKALSFRSAFLSWTSHFAGVPSDVMSRSLHMWARLTAWMKQHAPFIANTLRPGASPAAVSEAESALGLRVPPALVAILRAHDGQSLEFDETFDRYVTWRMRLEEQGQGGAGSTEPPPQPPRWHPSMVWGLFGGYSFYDHLASVRLFPLERIVRWTTFFRSHPHAQLPPHLVVAGASANLGKLLLIDTITGGVRLGGAQDHMPAAPPGDTGASDGCLRWMEEWSRRLAGGWYEVSELGVDRHKAPGVALFPVVEPAMSVQTTRGLQVRVSSVFAPEMCGEGGARYFFTYSVRFRLMSAEEQRQQQHYRHPSSQHAHPPAGDGPHRQQQVELPPYGGLQQQNGRSANDGVEYGSDGNMGQSNTAAGSADDAAAPAPPPAALLRRCQLESRHWRILSEEGDLSNEVSGEGVIGQYPLLEAGGPEYVYQSCTHQAERLGFMEGSFSFVEGSLARPEGPTFTAVCPRFELRVPEFIF